MPRISHVSFDVWNTLITANPAFAVARTEAIADLLATTPAIVKAAYTKVKRVADTDAERWGMAYTTQQLLEMLADSISPQIDVESKHVFCYLAQRHIRELFLKHPPVLNDGVKTCIHALAADGITLSIGSNSNFISGSVMYPWIQDKAHAAFSFGVFSDLQGTSKPSAAFFGHVVDCVRTLHNEQVSHPANIIHVGDSQRCDVWGASQLHINALLVSGPQDIPTAVPAFINAINETTGD